MIKIRHSCFETNSSSMDRYDDYRDDYGPVTAYGTERINIKLELEDMSTERFGELAHQVEDSAEMFEEILINLFDDIEVSCSEVELDDDTITCHFDVSGLPVELSGRYCPATRYSPEEYPDMEIDFSGLYPEQPDFNDPYYKKVESELLKLFADKGWKEFLSIIHIVGIIDNNFDYK